MLSKLYPQNIFLSVTLCCIEFQKINKKGLKKIWKGSRTAYLCTPNLKKGHRLRVDFEDASEQAGSKKPR